MIGVAEPYEENQILFRALAGTSTVYYEEWRVLRVTPKGAWIAPNTYPINWETAWWEEDDKPEEHALEQLARAKPYDNQKWVPVDARFASVSKDVALQRLRARTASYVGHCTRRLREAERRMRLLAGDPVPEQQPLRLGRLRITK